MRGTARDGANVPFDAFVFAHQSQSLSNAPNLISGQTAEQLLPTAHYITCNLLSLPSTAIDKFDLSFPPESAEPVAK